MPYGSEAVVPLLKWLGPKAAATWKLWGPEAAGLTASGLGAAADSAGMDTTADWMRGIGQMSLARQLAQAGGLAQGPEGLGPSLAGNMVLGPLGITQSLRGMGRAIPSGWRAGLSPGAQRAMNVGGFGAHAVAPMLPFMTPQIGAAVNPPRFGGGEEAPAAAAGGAPYDYRANVPPEYVQRMNAANLMATAAEYPEQLLALWQDAMEQQGGNMDFMRSAVSQGFNDVAGQSMRGMQAQMDPRSPQEIYRSWGF